MYSCRLDTPQHLQELHNPLRPDRVVEVAAAAAEAELFSMMGPPTFPSQDVQPRGPVHMHAAARSREDESLVVRESRVAKFANDAAYAISVCQSDNGA